MSDVAIANAVLAEAASGSVDNFESPPMSINHVEVIETVIASLDSQDSAMVSHTGGGYIWKFQYGSVEVFVQLSGTQEEDTLSVWSTVLKLPVNNEIALFRKLLQMNLTDTFESCFAILNNDVVVFSTRTLTDISPAEISRAITVVATIADNNDDTLKAEFS